MCEHAVSSIHLLNICIIWHPLYIFVRMCAWGSFVMIYQDNNKTSFISTHWVEHATVERTYIFCAAAFKWNGGMFSFGSWMCPHVFLFLLNELHPHFHQTMKCRINFGMSNRWTEPFELVLFCPSHLRSYPKKLDIPTFFTLWKHELMKH